MTNVTFTLQEPVDIIDGLSDEAAERMARNLEFKGAQLKQAAEQIKQLYNLFIKVDATQVEINPFGETPEGQGTMHECTTMYMWTLWTHSASFDVTKCGKFLRLEYIDFLVVCFDAKINFDDNAEFRQSDIFALDDQTETDPREKEATQYNLNYVGMDGNIGCLVNGAGLAMATMDIVKLYDGEPANFLDVGGGVTEKQVYHAFKILTADPQVSIHTPHWPHQKHSSLVHPPRPCRSCLLPSYKR